MKPLTQSRNLRGAQRSSGELRGAQGLRAESEISSLLERIHEEVQQLNANMCSKSVEESCQENQHDSALNKSTNRRKKLVDGSVACDVCYFCG